MTQNILNFHYAIFPISPWPRCPCLLTIQRFFHLKKPLSLDIANIQCCSHASCLLDGRDGAAPQRLSLSLPLACWLALSLSLSAGSLSLSAGSLSQLASAAPVNGMGERGHEAHCFCFRSPRCSCCTSPLPGQPGTRGWGETSGKMCAWTRVLGGKVCAGVCVCTTLRVESSLVAIAVHSYNSLK